jgi:hypothetical protein
MTKIYHSTKSDMIVIYFGDDVLRGLGKLHLTKQYDPYWPLSGLAMKMALILLILYTWKYIFCCSIHHKQGV